MFKALSKTYEAVRKDMTLAALCLHTSLRTSADRLADARRAEYDTSTYFPSLSTPPFVLSYCAPDWKRVRRDRAPTYAHVVRYCSLLIFFFLTYISLLPVPSSSRRNKKQPSPLLLYPQLALARPHATRLKTNACTLTPCTTTHQSPAPSCAT